MLAYIPRKVVYLYDDFICDIMLNIGEGSLPVWHESLITEVVVVHLP